MPDESKDPFAGTVVPVAVWVTVPLFVHFTMVFADTVIVDELNENSTIDTSVVPLPGHGTSCTVETAVAAKSTLVIFAPLTVFWLLVGVNVKPAKLGVIV